jgi:hypothetical protein
MEINECWRQRILLEASRKQKWMTKAELVDAWTDAAYVADGWLRVNCHQMSFCFDTHRAAWTTFNLSDDAVWILERVRVFGDNVREMTRLTLNLNCTPDSVSTTVVSEWRKRVERAFRKAVKVRVAARRLA